MSAGPPSCLSLTDKQKYRERLCAEVDGLRRQVEELRQHVQHGNPHQIPHDQPHLMAQLHGKRGLTPQHVSQLTHAQQLSQQQHRANIINSLSPSMVGAQDMLHPSSSMSPGGPTQGGMNDGVMISDLHRKQAELNEIVEQQRKLYSNLDNLDHKRSQILGDIDKTAAYQKITNDINFLQGQSAGGGRFPQLRSQLPQSHMPSHFPPSHMHPTNQQMRPPTSTGGGGRDALHAGYQSTMQFLANRSGLPSVRDHPSMGNSNFPPPSLMDPDGGFGNMSSGFGPQNTTGSALGSLRDRYEAKLQELGGGGNMNDPTQIDKRRRFLSVDALQDNVNQKQHLNHMSGKNFHENLRSSSFLPSEIMMTPKNPSAGDSLSVLSSSHQLLMNQREANMQRETQNMLFYQNMNGRNPMGITGMNRNQRQHDGKLPENKRKLPKDFVPEGHTVVLGKGNIPKTNIGNLRLKQVVLDNLTEYANGERRKKIAVISRIINHVTSLNYKTTGFVKFEDDDWWEMTERDARVKITALFRDCLHDQYRSSSSSKVKRRQELRKSRSLSAANATKTSSEEPEPKRAKTESSETSEECKTEKDKDN